MIEVIAIGNEILSGSTVNSNAATISSRLKRFGLRVGRHTVLSDDASALLHGFKEALQRSDLVITTGGLGPTFDDITKRIAAELFDSPLSHNEEIYAELLKRFGPHSSLKEQSNVPSKAGLLKNALGTAPGFAFPKENPKLFMLPGVPREMELMLENEVIPRLTTYQEKEKRHFETEIHLCHLWESKLEPLIKELIVKYPEVEFGIYPKYGVVSVHLRILAGNQVEADKKFIPIKEEIARVYSSYIFPSSQGLIEEAVHEMFLQKKKTLILAESCSGGSIAARLTGLSGASEYFQGSIVSYSDRMKESTLHVSKKTLRIHGAVSAETVKEMLLGAFALSGADYAVAVSGIAGPTGGTKEKPVGTVWVALGENGQMPDVGLLPAAHAMIRKVIIEYTVTYALGCLWRKIQFGKKAFSGE